jgi:hypothetical protein
MRRIAVAVFDSARDRVPHRKECSVGALFRSCTKFHERPDIVSKARNLSDGVDRMVSAIEGRGVVRPWMEKSKRYTRLLRAHREGDLAVQAQKMRDSAPRVAKTNLRAFSCVTYEDGATRGNAGVISLSALVLDFDDGDHWHDVLPAFRGHPRAYYTSWSHSDDHPKWRLVVPLARDVPAAMWPRVWKWAQDRVEGKADAQCKDPARLAFAPAVRSSNWPRAAGVVDVRGALLNVLWETLPKHESEKPKLPKKRRAYRWDLAEKRRGYQVAHGRYRTHDERLTAAHDLGAALRSGAAFGITCPSCGHNSVWFNLEPHRMYRAACNHRESCGWTGSVASLVEAA